MDFCGSFVMRYKIRIGCIEVMSVPACDLKSIWFKYSFSFNRYKSNEDYVYVRGRGRGKYICEECGIRCKKPSMLKKHIRTHTDVRPYVCKLCNFAFKTKGTWPFFLNFCSFTNKSWDILPSGIQAPFAVKERIFFETKRLCLWIQDSVTEVVLFSWIYPGILWDLETPWIASLTAVGFDRSSFLEIKYSSLRTALTNNTFCQSWYVVQILTATMLKYTRQVHLLWQKVEAEHQLVRKTCLHMLCRRSVSSL